MTVCVAILVFVMVVTLGFALYLDNLARSLPDLRTQPSDIVIQRTTVVYAADGSTLAEWHGEQDRTVVPYDAMSSQLRNAVVAVEDHRFYEHHGIDSEAISRLLNGKSSRDQSDSTITQQVVKNLFTSGKRRTFLLKIREALLANALEARADKAQVLALYLNTVYLGRGYYGVETAAQRYFGKPTQSLTLAEAATIAGIIDSPTKYSPLDHPEAALSRRNDVLRKMSEQGYISLVQKQTAVAEPLGLHSEVAKVRRAPYFVEYVKQDLVERFGAERLNTGGLRVFTSLDPEMQARAEKAARMLSQMSDPEVALVAVRHKDGKVLALVGGRDFAQNQFNLAVQGRRQPGSAFKPFVLATALKQGVKPETKYSAAPYSVPVKDGVWNVQNYENEITGGRISLRAATNWSVNAVYARLMMQVGPENVVQTAKQMGITTPLDADPAIALGGLRTGVSPLEMASAYGTIANGGTAVPPSGVIRVIDDRGDTVYQPTGATHRALDEAVAAQESTMLHSVIEKGTGVKAKMGRWAAGKTGTTQSYRDAWFVGWSGDVATAVWVGHRDGQVAMTDVHGIKVTGGSFPASIWGDFMKASNLQTVPSSSTVRESGDSVLVRACPDSLLAATSRCPHPVDSYLSPATVPTLGNCTLH